MNIRFLTVFIVLSALSALSSFERSPIKTVEIAHAQVAENPYSFATGKRVNIQKEENAVGEATGDIFASLKGKKGEKLALVAGAVAAVTYFVGLRALGLSLTILALGTLAIPRPYLAMILTILIIVVSRFRTRDDDRYAFRPKKDNEKSDDSKGSDTPPGKTGNPTGASSSSESKSGSGPKISRPM